MPQNDAVMRDLADRFDKAIKDRNLDGIRALFHPDAVFWTNIGQTDTDLETRLAGIALEFEIFETFGFEEVRVDPFADGFVLRAQGRGSIRGGASFEFPICLVVEARNGRLVRFEEYVDPNPVAPIIAALEAARGNTAAH